MSLRAVIGPALWEVLFGVIVLLNHKDFSSRRDETHRGARMLGGAAVILGQILLVFGSNADQFPKHVLILFKAVLSLCAAGLLIGITENRKKTWFAWFLLLFYTLSVLPVNFTVMRMTRKCSKYQERELGSDNLSPSERNAIANLQNPRR
eukprot:TRINITY_DN63006_c0_g1_i1.p1 TRINITY_DN63006_c0_g1~~TRINITY_DN63006_c0_g1_i1.p1  ORF type:complete len:150 (-),score=25.74 TRINITY_DN63006_c0_g1_i1:109-558(-)